jgi:geranylgeranyl pyrophosphate synthase
VLVSGRIGLKRAIQRQPELNSSNKKSKRSLLSVPSSFSHKDQISKHLARLIELQLTQWSDHDWAQPLLSELLEYAKRGKMVRGSVLIESWRMYAAKTSAESQPVPESVLTGAVIIELLESALLIHDDIIDRDELRRGMPSFHTSMRKFSRPRLVKKSWRIELGVATGDTFFIVFSILGHEILRRELV